MRELRETELFTEWLGQLRDKVAKVKIAARLRRLALGNPGDVQPIGGGLSELRIHHGPGYRVYFVQRGGALIPAALMADRYRAPGWRAAARQTRLRPVAR